MKTDKPKSLIATAWLMLLIVSAAKANRIGTQSARTRGRRRQRKGREIGGQHKGESGEYKQQQHGDLRGDMIECREENEGKMR